MRINDRGPEPVYQQIAKNIREGIKAGAYVPGRPVPSIVQIRQETGHAVMTIRKALRLLADEGWVRIVSGKGTFVNPPDSWPHNDAG